MIDQASELRELVRNHGPQRTEARANRPKWITVSGGKGGVGTTTLAVNLALALARQHGPTLLVDADPDRADAAVLCGVEPRVTVVDVLAGRCALEDAILPGPGPMAVLPGSPATEVTPEAQSAAVRRLIGPLGELGHRFEYLVVDGGNGSGPRTRQMWHAADLVLLVTTAELPSIMDAYASVKLLTDSTFHARIQTLVNMAVDPADACEVHNRLARASQRFLGLHLESAGHVPGDRQVVAAAATGRPAALTNDGVPAVQQIVRLARTLAATLAVGSARAAG